MLTSLLPKHVKDENSRVILWVMCDCQKFLDKVSEIGCL